MQPPAYPINIVFLESLKNFWNTVEPLEISEARNVTDIFVQKHVRLDFHKKFYNGGKPIKDRFFRSYMKIETTTMSNVVTNSPIASHLSATVIWGSYHNPMGYHVEGKHQTLHRLFVDEGNAFACLDTNRKQFFLYLSGHTGEMYLFPP